MRTFLPSIASRQFGKFHLVANSFSTTIHSDSVCGTCNVNHSLFHSFVNLFCEFCFDLLCRFWKPHKKEMRKEQRRHWKPMMKRWKKQLHVYQQNDLQEHGHQLRNR